jgi:hypothetical protein
LTKFPITGFAGPAERPSLYGNGKQKKYMVERMEGERGTKVIKHKKKELKMK